jgi:hypothetical protein
MNEYANFIKEKLDTLLTEMHEYSWLFVNNPEKDFTRKRKLDFKDMLGILLSMGGNSLKLELMNYFSYDAETATSSAFVHQRDKILPDALELLFHRFTTSAVSPNYYDGYRMLAVDGSDLSIAHNPSDVENHFTATENMKGFNLLHLNAMYDLCSRVYVDTIIQPGRNKNEFKALTHMVDRSDIKEQTIVIADRGYGSYNVFEHIRKKNWNYFPVGDKGIYPINFRVVRFAISENTYEVIITNLTEKEFPAEKIKEIYHLRWGIETSFRELKYAIGLTSFHSKKAVYILQEIFARLTMYNFCEIITNHVVIQQEGRKYSYQVNFTMAISICLHYFKCKNGVSSPNVEALIQKNILPVRNGRKDPRKVRTKSSVSFIYRVA